MLSLEYSQENDQSRSLSITEIINCETGSHFNVQKAILHATLGRSHVTGSQTLLRSARNQLHTTLPLIRDSGNRKRLFLIRSELLGQFVNTLTADYKFSRQNWKNLRQKDPMQTSMKLKTCSRFFIAFLKSRLYLLYFQKKH